MPKNDTGEFELVLGNRQLLSGFAVVVFLLGWFFAMGYIVGRNSTPSSRAAAADTQSPAASAPDAGRAQNTPPSAAPATATTSEAAGATAPPPPAADATPVPTTQPAKPPEAPKPAEK